MKLLFDFFPTLLFLIAYFSGKAVAKASGVDVLDIEIQGLMWGIPVMVLATAFQLLYNWLKHKKVEKIHIIAFALLIVFGGVALYFQSKFIFALKVSIINWLFAIVFFAMGFKEKNLVQRMLEKSVELPKNVYSTLNTAYIIFFIILGVINLLIYFSVSFDSWVLFKLFGFLGLMVIFMIGQVFYLRKYLPDEMVAKEAPVNPDSNKQN